jgi:hypothetical protein
MSSPTTFPNAPVPTEGELRKRSNLFVQAGRFAVLNVKMILMVTKGHH